MRISPRHLWWDGVGAVVSALVVALFFLGPAVFGIVYAFIRPDMVAVLVTAEPPPVHFDGAFVLGEEETPGVVDPDVLDPGPVSETPEPDPTDEAPEEDEPAPEPEAPEPAPKPGPPEPEPDPDPAPTGEEGGDGDEGGDVIADPTTDGEGGLRGGDRLGSGGSGGGARAGSGRRGGGGAARSRHRCPRSHGGISLRRDGVYEISRELVNYHTASVKRFNALGGSRSNQGGDGWVITGFSCHGPLWHGGLRRGDIILTVNGKKTNNMMQILRLYPKMRTQRHFEVVLLRRGRQMTLRYEVVRP